MAKTAIVNYTPEMIETMTEMYKSALGDTERKEMVTTISETLGKSVASIRAKLSKLGVYIKPKPTTKSGSVVIRKAELVNNIADLLGKDADLLGSLEKATKFSLEAVIAGLTPAE